MKTPKRMLVVISGRRAEHSALERALKFAELDNIYIRLLNAIYKLSKSH
jgi:universal stress protein E